MSSQPYYSKKDTPSLHLFQGMEIGYCGLCKWNNFCDTDSRLHYRNHDTSKEDALIILHVSRAHTSDTEEAM